MTTAQAVGAVSSEATEWYAIDWPTIHRSVRRLQVRIAQATKEGSWDKVRALQRLLILETASPFGRRSKGLSWLRGNSHAQFLEGWATARSPGYSAVGSE